MVITVGSGTLLMNFFLKSEIFNENLYLPLLANEGNYNPMIIEISKDFNLSKSN